VDIYYRSAIAEAIALTIIPAVLYYAYGLIFNREKKVIALSVSISLLVYTHVLTTLLCSALIACMIIVRLFLSKQIKNDI
ncbi:cell surface protein, partial [Enterococcus faecium]